ncbi:MAG: hypothetical protein HC877_07305 [Thioploca sp.]|nr:hypothetical protein [Thioploca sp.]
MSTFEFSPRWKDLVTCRGPGGSFILDSGSLPTEIVWKEKAPSWAKKLWPVLKEELEAWYKERGAQLIIDERASVYHE